MKLGLVSRAIVGFSPALMDEGLGTVTEEVDTCVRDEFCDAVRFRGREMNGEEYAGEGPIRRSVSAESKRGKQRGPLTCNLR
jgi:hypothetical protein